MPTGSENRAAWLGRSGFGLMVHYIDEPASSNIASATTAAEWNRRVDAFDVARFARRVRESGAGHVIFTLGQNTGHYCSPNSVYDGFTGVQPSRLSHRDLIAEIAEALAPEVRLIVYLPSHAPNNHIEAVAALRCTPPWDGGKWGLSRFWPDMLNADERLTTFQRRWEAVVGHWGERWGELVAGWWISGCYYADRLYAGAEEPNFASFARALRRGNANRVLAFSAGVGRPFARLTPEQDYTAGEVGDLLIAGRKPPVLEATTEGMQTHAISFLGEHWGGGRPRFTTDQVVAGTRGITSRGAALTWDVPITATGEIPDAFLRQCAMIAAGASNP